MKFYRQWNHFGYRYFTLLSFSITEDFWSIGFLCFTWEFPRTQLARRLQSMRPKHGEMELY